MPKSQARPRGSGSKSMSFIGSSPFIAGTFENHIGRTPPSGGTGVLKRSKRRANPSFAPNMFMGFVTSGPFARKTPYCLRARPSGATLSRRLPVCPRL
jgi:hypothetical protein